MAHPKFTPLELQIMQALWDRGSISIREILEAFPDRERPAYTTFQTTIYRLEAKGPCAEFTRFPMLTSSKPW